MDNVEKVVKGLTAVFLTAALGVVAVNGYGLSDQKSAEKVLADDERFTVQEYKGHNIRNIMDCGRGDLWRDEFKVIRNKTGKETTVVVCQSLFQAGTVRILGN